MTSKTIYTPYFYIIQHKTSKKMYAGARWAKGCHPNEFMQPKGYQTSSPIILEIINHEGIGAFIILRIDTNLDGLSAYNYETLFLQCLNCASSDDWINRHNNTGKCPAYGTDQFKQLINDKYGNENYNNSKKNKETCLKKYGVDHPNKRDSERGRASNTAKLLNKRKDMVAMLHDRNVNNNPSKLPENKIKASIRFKETNIRMLKEGIHPTQKQENKDAASARMKITMANLPVLICPYCNKEGKYNMTKWHFNNCKLKT